MNFRPTDKLITSVLALLVLSPGLLVAAEVRGTVSVNFQGLFQQGETTRAYPVSVVLLPAEGQHTVRRPQKRRTIEVVGNRMQPAFVTVQRGDSVEFVNRDDVFHELYSLSPGKPVKARLGKAGDYGHDRTVFKLDETGTTHFFCRIHNKSYARIDVVDTPYIRMVESGDSFAFTGLAPGRWRLRLTAPAAETEWVEVSAVTAPPPLQLTLHSHGGGSGTSAPGKGADVSLLYRTLAEEGGGR
jgi:plastocyanin